MTAASTTANTTAPRTLYEVFSRAAAAHPDATALEIGDERLTYAELRHLADRAAARLTAAAGGAPPRRVGLLAGRTAAAYVGYLAILRTGATVVPLNPGFPPGRNAAVAGAAGLDLTIAEDAEAGKETGVPLLLLDRDDVTPGADHAATVAAEPGPAGPDDVAYVIFTSGSTGTPKGVPVLHRNICTHLAHIAQRYAIGPGSRLSQSFELTFDGSVHDLFVAWASGGTLVVPTQAQLMAPVKFVNSRRLTHWFSVPAIASFASRLGTLRPDSMPDLRWSIFGGEALPAPLARAWQAAAPRSTLEVLYGPTETTISCTQYRPGPRVEDWPQTPNGTMPIGEPYPTTEVVVLDEQGRPGDVGELCVRGPQRFPGYLDAADDAGRFLAIDDDGTVHPYDGNGPLTEAHWYRTGDRVAREDFGLVHLGRTDHQVKVRGYRIELGEVEGPLRTRPGVTEAAVVAVPGPDGQQELVAAVSGTGLDADTLFAGLRDRLPEYMLPRRIEVLAEMPHNTNGKIDRHAVLARVGQSAPTAR
ncbi:amino acid adenylation domain-containing protein [Streptomyces sp. DSM 42041]|uniref:Amino acid adenylation domain-containing protein n=1 Tax=Streptomyces hazeniae TaxID=3075538 RepID=A0ABU2NUA3_9ACTN|nr:amino acid adenylation domain-containing protein [Streptomyces sp. DSM 42041]MDT0380196.1 amino acid adenylation domain-containing protein [Streptomyces sp. DSM 42041]